MVRNKLNAEILDSQFCQICGRKLRRGKKIKLCGNIYVCEMCYKNEVKNNERL